MSKRISELGLFQHLDDPATVETVVVKDGDNYRMPVSAILEQVTAETVGLGRVDNTSDSDKPVSYQQQLALNLKSEVMHVHQAKDIQDLETVIETKVTQLLGNVDGMVLAGAVQW